MISVPVLCDDTVDILDITARYRRGHGDLTVSGSLSPEVEDEIRKAISAASELSEFGEFSMPRLSDIDLHIDFRCRVTELPVSGVSYGLGLAVELLRLFSKRSFSASQCFTAGIDDSGNCTTVGGLAQKIAGSIHHKFTCIYVPASQLIFDRPQIDIVYVSSIPDAWSKLAYEPERRE